MTALWGQSSIRRRLLILLTIGAVFMAVVAYVVVQGVARQIARESQDNILAASVQSILDSASVASGEITIDLPYSALSMLDTQSDERVFYAIYLDGEFLSGYDSLPLQDAELDGTQHNSARVRGVDVRVASAARGLSTDLGSSVLEVSVAQTLVGLQERLERINNLSLWIGAGFFLGVTIMAFFIAGATTRPLHRLTGSISRRGPSDLRPVEASVPAEMVPLVRALNGFMQRLGTSLERSEDFIAEAAHRVRTPLAIVRTQAEITLHRVEKPENRAAVREMIRAIDESSRTAGQLLDHAMVTFRVDHLAQDAIALPDLVTDAVDRLAPLSEMRDITLETSRLDDAHITGDAILVQNALRNVLDNAIKYSPDDSIVDIRLTQKDEFAHITVSDRGQGIPEADRAAMTGRFVRGENAEGTVGSGLGLTIVNDIVRAHGGRLSFETNDGGGTCVTLSFPLR